MKIVLFLILLIAHLGLMSQIVENPVGSYQSQKSRGVVWHLKLQADSSYTFVSESGKSKWHYANTIEAFGGDSGTWYLDENIIVLRHFNTNCKCDREMRMKITKEGKILRPQFLDWRKYKLKKI